MHRVLGKYAPYLYAVLRIITGLMFTLHGSEKLLGFPPYTQGPPPGISWSLVLVGAVIELVGGLMIALGLWTSYAAFVASGEMAVGYFVLHARHGLLPTVNQGERAVLYCFVFLYFAAQGSGVWSLDALRGRQRLRPTPATDAGGVR